MENTKINKISFASDNSSGVHTKVLQAIAEANRGHAMPYGDDIYTKHVTSLFKKTFGPDSEIFLVFTGTGANVIALESVTRSYETIICSEKGHVFDSETGAPEKLTGCKLTGLPTVNGKINASQLKQIFSSQEWIHSNKPGAISIAQLTELGTAYNVSELSNLSKIAHRNNVYFHIDGARFANAAVNLNINLQELTEKSGVDLLSFGGTKNGLLSGEAIICFNQDIATRLKYIRKQSLNLASKMRYLSAQFIPYLEDNLWYECADQANKMASKIVNGISNLKSINILYPVEGNMIFIKIPQVIAHKLAQLYHIYILENKDDYSTVRLVCSFNTTKNDVDCFINSIKSLFKEYNFM